MNLPNCESIQPAVESGLKRDTSVTTPQMICPVCSGARLEPFFERTDVPVYCNVLWATREAALDCPKREIKLGYCRNCGFIRNLAFDPQLLAYDQNYENSLHFSPQFQDYAQALAHHLISRYELEGKNIIEIGCGKGEFLALLCRLGNNRGYGFDPSYQEGRVDRTIGRGITFIQDFYSERFASYPCDFVCCRHTLEHIGEPAMFLVSLRRTLVNRPHAVVFFEVPNALFTLRQGGIWDIIYEHCSYFTAPALTRLFRSCGFHVQETREAFGGQFLTMEALLDRGGADGLHHDSREVEQIAQDVVEFDGQYRAKVEHWRQNLEVMKQSRKRVVIWGAGSKGVTFLNAFGKENPILHAVDINPHKQGKFVPGTGQEVVSPEFLGKYRPDVVLVMNPNYRNEINQCIAAMGLEAELVMV